MSHQHEVANPATAGVSVPDTGAARLSTLRTGEQGWILLRPNRSLTRCGLFVAAAACLGGLIPIVLFFVLLGAWPVLPFLGLEMVVVLASFLWLSRHHDDHERLHIEPERIVHVRIDGRRTESRSFPRYWARLVIEPAAGRARAPRLWLRSHGRETELGRDGSAITREALVRTLTGDFGIPRSSVSAGRHGSAAI